MSKAAEQQRSIKEGEFAPDFTAKTDNNGEITLSELRGKTNVVLYFYPKDDTPGCTIEAKDFTKLKEEFDSAKTLVLGVSKDDVASHDKFKEKHCLSIDLLSDDNGTLCEAYDVWGEKNMYGKKYMGILRTTFLIDKAGKVRKIWNNVKVDSHAEQVLAEAKKL